jgi:hypothetical protein
MKRFLPPLFALALLFAFARADADSREIVLYSFENGPEGWEIPDWTFEKKDYVGKEVSISEFYSSEGKYSFELKSEFAGEPGWRGAYAECANGVSDWSIYKWLSVDIYLPKEAPHGLKARIILTVGDEWKWSEMNKAVPLAPGEWTVIKVNLKPDSLDWRRFITDEFRSDVKKIGVRIESNGGIKYTGPVYIDNVRLFND